METVELDYVVCHSPLTTRDKELLRKRIPQRGGRTGDYENEDIYFWIDGIYRGHGRHVFTTYVA